MESRAIYVLSHDRPSVGGFVPIFYVPVSEFFIVIFIYRPEMFTIWLCAGIVEDQSEHDPIVNSPVTEGSVYQSVEEGGNNNDTGLSQSQTTGNGMRKPEKSWLAKQWAGVDNRYFKPLLTHSYPTLMDTLPNRCLSLGRVFTSREQIMRHPMMRDPESTASATTDCDSIFTTTSEKPEVLSE